MKNIGLSCLIAGFGTCFVPLLMAIGIYASGSCYTPFAGKADSFGDLVQILFMETGWNTVFGMGLAAAGSLLLLLSRRR